MNPALDEIVEYRKSGLSLNWIIGCPLGCSYCVRHLFGNFGMTVPRALVDDQAAVEMLVGHRYFRAGRTPVQLLNRATDPFLPVVKPHLFAVLRMLDEMGFTNHVLVITRWRVEPADVAELDSLLNLRVTLLVTYSGIADDRIEPVDSRIAETSLRTAYERASRVRVVLYWRPIVPGCNDSDAHLEAAMELSEYAHATVFTGLFFRDEIRDYYRAHGLPEPYTESARRKILPERLEGRILAAAGARGPAGSPLFRKTSCAVSYVHRAADYNGHIGVRELCDICPPSQVSRCTGSRSQLDHAVVAARVAELGGRLVNVGERAVVVEGLGEQDRYLLQHAFGHQVHDVARPHREGHHGRADLGWPSLPGGAAR